MRQATVVVLLALLAGCGRSEPSGGSVIPQSAAKRAPARPAVLANAMLVATYYNSSTGGVAAFTAQGNILTTKFPNVDNPVRVAWDPHDRFIYVLNYAAGNNSFVTAYDVKGNQQPLTGGFPFITKPTGIVYDSHDGLIYISDTPSGKKPTVSAFTEQGKPQRLTGTFGTGAPEQDLTFDPKNDFIYVAEGKTIHAYDEQGVRQTLTGAFLNADTPSTIVHDAHTGGIYAAQSVLGGTVVVYDDEGHLIKQNPGFNLSNPLSVAYDPATNFIYVTIATTGQHGGHVALFDEQGTPQSLSGGFGRLSIGDITVVR